MTVQNFGQLHPFSQSLLCATDLYYNRIAKKIEPMLMPMRSVFDWSVEMVKETALKIAAYFEDQVSQLGLWTAFTHGHRELYGRWLPWYDTSDDYYQDEVNLQDIKFLLWMYQVATEKGDYTSPQNSMIHICAERIFKFLLDNFEKAPINETLLKTLYSDSVTEDFYHLKKVLIWISESCYLMSFPLWQKEIRESIRNYIRATVKDAKPDWVNYSESSYSSMQMRMGPLALYPKEWFVLMRQQRGLTKDNEKILDLEGTMFYTFFVESNNGGTLTLRSVRDVVYEVDSSSFNGSFVKDLKTGMAMDTMLARYKGKWLMNGTVSGVYGYPDCQVVYKDKIKEMAERLKKNNRPVDKFSQYDQSIIREPAPKIKRRIDDEIAKNNGKRLFYFENPSEVLQWQESIFDAPFSAQDRETFLSHNDQAPMMILATENYALYSLSQPETIDDPDNPYYDPEEAYLASEMLCNKRILDEVCAYFVKHGYLSHLNFSYEWESPQNAILINDNLHFWATFLRQYPM